MFLRLSILALSLFAGVAHAAIDVASAIAGVGDASQAVLIVLAGMVVMHAGTWGLKAVMRLFAGDGGASDFDQLYDSGEAVAGVDFFDADQPADFADTQPMGRERTDEEIAAAHHRMQNPTADEVAAEQADFGDDYEDYVMHRRGY